MLKLALATLVVLATTAVGDNNAASAEGKPTTQRISPADLPNVLCFWDFQDGPDRLRSTGKHAYVLAERNGPIESVPDGVFGECALRIEHGQWLSIPGRDCPGLNLLGDAHVTVVAWIQRQCDAPWQYIAGVWNERDARRQYALFTCGHKQTNHKTMDRSDAKHQTHGYVSDVGGATPGKPFCFSYATGKTRIVESVWHMIAFTYDQRQITVYFDGQVDRNGDYNPFPWNKPIYKPLGEPTDFTVAQRALPKWPGYPQQEAPPHKEGFGGLLGGLAVYDRALTSDELRRLYESTLKAKKSSEQCDTRRSELTSPPPIPISRRFVRTPSTQRRVGGVF